MPLGGRPPKIVSKVNRSPGVCHVIVWPCNSLPAKGLPPPVSELGDAGKPQNEYVPTEISRAFRIRNRRSSWSATLGMV